MKTDDFREDFKALCEQYLGHDTRRYTIDYTTKISYPFDGVIHKISVTFNEEKFKLKHI